MTKDGNVVQLSFIKLSPVGRAPIPLRYPGGKYYALKILKPFWEAVEHDEYREPFVGGGSVFFAKNKVKFNWLNDIHKELMTTYKVMAEPRLRERLVRMVSKEEASKKRHKEVLSLKPKTKLETAFKYYYLNRTSFSGKMRHPAWGYRPKRSLPPFRWRERIIPCGEKLEGVKLTSLDFEEVIKAPRRGKSVLMFLDPPYFLGGSNGHYIHLFTRKDHLRLANVLRDTRYKFFLTYDDCKKVRELYEWAYIYPIKFFYRIDNSQDRQGRRTKGFELVVTNYKVS